MFRLSAIDAVRPAFERTRGMLFRPFRFKTWLKLGFIGWLAGAGGGSFNLNMPSFPGGGGSSGSTAGHDVERTVGAFLSEHLLLILFIVAASFMIGLAFVYLSCRFRFVLFDSILQRDPQIARGWRLYSREADRYFAFVVCCMGASLIVLALVVGVPLWHAFKSGIFKSDNQFPALFTYVLAIVLGVFLFVIIAAIIGSLANDFAVPVLALDRTTIGGAWSVLKQMISADPWAFAGYLGMKLLLSIAAGIVTAIAMLVVFLVLLIPGVIVVMLGVVIVKAAGPAGTVLGIILAVIAALVAIALVLLLTLVVTAPVIVFFTSYAFYFLGGRYPRLGALLWPQPPAPVVPPPLVPPPPLPGAAPAM
jgi:hypothetical protein